MLHIPLPRLHCRGAATGHVKRDHRNSVPSLDTFLTVKLLSSPPSSYISPISPLLSNPFYLFLFTSISHTMANKVTLPLLLILTVALLYSLHTASTEAASTAKTGADESVLVTGEGDKENEASESWATWAKDKISEGLGIKHQHVDEAEEKAEEVARKTQEAGHAAKDTTGGIASEVGEYTKEKTGDAKDSAKNAKDSISGKVKDSTARTASETKHQTGEATEATKQTTTEARNKAAEKASAVKDATIDKAKEAAAATKDKAAKAQEATTSTAGEAANKVKEGYDAAKSKAGEKLDAAKETLSSNFEAAKEKVVGVSQRHEEEL
ncbi:hypothetical protein IEQ34_011699 [Dendrobium chrysotoxum]|uniref:Late embryogenesis abundant protein n=1 Tax=Dendrobium chrysotoxum TaxID=161865 RepID=A0AAV7GUF5_DENCH|nr:hypothetical protein IEQ34_011699 [Dendrobium chrysotoxum]